ncbi:Ctf8-domain-containing protein [Ganoderma leucocontextum]|nr:Ctf8-domain-containing protein [Ganoderma leucocontextum]
MLIPINIDIPGPSTPRRPHLPPQLVQFGTDELVLIELQGALEVEGNKDGQLVGELEVDSATKKPTLKIGYHRLEGKLVNLNKPLAVLHRHDSQPPDDEDAGMEVDEDEDEGRVGKTTEAKSWDMIAIVKRKMVFSKRPMPVVTKPDREKNSSGAPLSRIGSKAWQLG